MGTSVIIIGAGIAGLSAGCYAQMNGFQSRVFELHSLPGGLCTAWKRGGYVFDGCIEWLMGTNPQSGLHRVWTELGAVQGRRFVAPEEFMRYETRDGQSVVFYSDVDRFERHLIELAPQDTPVIKEMARAVRRIAGLDMPVDPTPIDMLRLVTKVLPALGYIKKYGQIDICDYANRFSSPLIREAIAGVADLSGYPALGLLMPLAVRSAKNGGYPLGGSLEFSEAIARRYTDLGGQVNYRSRVERILVENDRAVGVRLVDGTEYRADYVISAADGHATIFDMLEGKYVDDRIRSFYEGGLEPFPPMIQVSLGVARDFSDEPRMMRFSLPEPVEIAGRTERSIGVKHFCGDPAMAPAGKSALVLSFLANYEYWCELHKDHSRYDEEKKRIAQMVIACLEGRFPGITEQVEVIDVATPMTFERYTGNWRASFEGWLISTKTVSMMFGPNTIPKTLPGLANFHMIGQWTTIGGGLPPAAQDGRNVIRRICRFERRPFRVELPAGEK